MSDAMDRDVNAEHVPPEAVAGATDADGTMGQVAGTIALFGAFLIMIIILAVLAMIVVKALAESPWGMFTVIATMPIAIFMGLYMRYIRPGRIGEISPSIRLR